jgi:hypothetical protein
MHRDNQTIIKERIYLDKADRRILAPMREGGHPVTALVGRRAASRPNFSQITGSSPSYWIIRLRG